LELKEKLPAADTKAPSKNLGGDRDRLIAALTNMGYRAVEAERAVKALGEEVGKQPLASLLREALKQLTP
jgi:Holliday junction resolvasome RuvABC DNA-binding subunit